MYDQNYLQHNLQKIFNEELLFENIKTKILFEFSR